MITLPVTIEQLITTIQQLQPSDREQIAKALIQVELQSDLKNLTAFSISIWDKIGTVSKAG
jgi:hypothetical protein